jgi:hypothetical protein
VPLVRGTRAGAMRSAGQPVGRGYIQNFNNPRFDLILKQVTFPQSIIVP